MTAADETGTERFEYPRRDHLGSVEAVSAAGPVLALAHDPYGARRAADWSRALTDAESAALSDVRPRGCTGHEHLDRVGLIHANGRLYDPRLGRYLSPDAAVSDPTSGQDWNGYSYVANSPLSFTDPTGMVRAGPGCNVGGVMCMDAGGGHADSPATYPEPYSVRVTIPVVTPFSVWGGGGFWGGGLPGEGGYGGPFGWFGGHAVSQASINVSGVVDRSTGVGTRGPGDRSMAETAARWALDFFVLDTVHAAAETVADVRAGNYGGAAVGAALVLCDVVKGCKLLTKVPGADRVVDWLKRRAGSRVADLPMANSQIGDKFRRHRNVDRPGYRNHLEYRQRAIDILNDPTSKKTVYPKASSRYPGETHYQLGDELLRLDSDGAFRSLYHLKDKPRR